MAVSPILQIARMLRQGSSSEISVGYFGLLIPGFVLWVLYGLANGDLFLALPNALAAAVGLAVIAVALALRRSEEASVGDG